MLHTTTGKKVIFLIAIVTAHCC